MMWRKSMSVFRIPRFMCMFFPLFSVWRHHHVACLISFLTACTRLHLRCHHHRMRWWSDSLPMMIHYMMAHRHRWIARMYDMTAHGYTWQWMMIYWLMICWSFNLLFLFFLWFFCFLFYLRFTFWDVNRCILIHLLFHHWHLHHLRLLWRFWHSCHLGHFWHFRHLRFYFFWFFLIIFLNNRHWFW